MMAVKAWDSQELNGPINAFPSPQDPVSNAERELLALPSCGKREHITVIKEEI